MSLEAFEGDPNDQSCPVRGRPQILPSASLMPLASGFSSARSSGSRAWPVLLGIYSIVGQRRRGGPHHLDAVILRAAGPSAAGSRTEMPSTTPPALVYERMDDRGVPVTFSSGRRASSRTPGGAAVAKDIRTGSRAGDRDDAAGAKGLPRLALSFHGLGCRALPTWTTRPDSETCQTGQGLPMVGSPGKMSQVPADPAAPTDSGVDYSRP